MIEVFASRLTDEGVERYETEKPLTVLAWLRDNGITVPDEQLDMLPMSVYVNGDQLMPSQWWREVFSPTDHVEIYREPKGTDPFSITFALIFGAKAALNALMPKLPTINSNNRGSGEALDEATAKGNKVKINELTPELAGFNPARYPDYVTSPRRYFAGPREQRIEMNLCVGIGRYVIPPARVKAGQTPLLSMGADATFAFYAPGADMSADPAHLAWYTAPEVGASSTGAAGLELTVGSNLTSQATASVFQFVGDSVNIPVGAGSFPADWVDGLIIAVAAPYPYLITDGTGDDGRDIISGDITQLGFVAGDTIEIGGDNAGNYIVHSATATELQLDYEGGAPASGLVLGSVTMAIAFRGLRWRILTKGTQTLLVERLKSDGSTDDDWPGWTDLSSNQGRVRLDSSNLVGGFRGPFPACPESELVTRIEWDNLFPGGIVGLGAKGDQYTVSTSQQFEYRDMAISGAWTTVNTSSSGATLNAIGVTHAVDLPYPMRPECRQKRSPKIGGENSSEVQDTTMWIGLKGLMVNATQSVFPNTTMMTCNIRGGDRLASQTESLVSVECTRILPVLRSGVWTTPVPTREISAWIGYIMRSVGYSDTEDLDIVELERLETDVWTPRGDTYDRIITSAGTVKSMLQECLTVGFSDITIDRGVIKPIRDELRGDVFDHVYNPQVMLKPLTYEFQAPDLPDQFDGVDVEYFSHATRQDEVMRCRLRLPNGEFEPGIRVQKLTLKGVGNPEKVWQWGMRERRKMLYRTKSFSFNTELDALNSSYFDYAALGVNVPGYGQSSEMKAFAVMGANTLIQSTQPFDWTQPGTYKVIVRRRDGTASGPYIATRIDDYRFTIPGTLDFVPDLTGITEPPVLQFGHGSKWVYAALITDVTPNGTKSCKVDAVNYDIRVYTDDDNYDPA